MIAYIEKKINACSNVETSDIVFNKTNYVFKRMRLEEFAKGAVTFIATNAFKIKTFVNNV